MEWIDTHTHLYVAQFDEDRNETVQRALDAGISRLYLPNIDQSSIEVMLAMEARWPGICFPMMGLHPCSVGEHYQEELAVVERWLDRRPFAAVGEIGLDFYWDTTFRKEQEEAFRTQIRWAHERNLPVVIHSRDSIDRNIELIREADLPGLRGIFHCFTGTVAQGRTIRELGFLLGIGGVLTFKNAGLDRVIAELGPEGLVLETDSPYLAPTPYRGKRNESAFLIKIAERLADILQLSMEEVAALSSRNALGIFDRTTAKKEKERI